MAYPRRNKADRSDIRIAVRVTAAEVAAIREAAHREHLTVSEYVRTLTLAAVSPTPAHRQSA